jgi:Sec-independent protein translocase protein TatA
MDILGIGPLEFVFIILIALIILGPNDMIKAGRSFGKLLRSVVTSPNWKVLQEASKDIRSLPDKLIREAGIENLKDEFPSSKELEKETGLDQLSTEVKDIQSSIADWTTPPALQNPKHPSVERTSKEDTSSTQENNPPESLE